MGIRWALVAIGLLFGSSTVLAACASAPYEPENQEGESEDASEGIAEERKPILRCFDSSERLVGEYPTTCSAAPSPGTKCSSPLGVLAARAYNNYYSADGAYRCFVKEGYNDFSVDKNGKMSGSASPTPAKKSGPGGKKCIRSSYCGGKCVLENTPGCVSCSGC